MVDQFDDSDKINMYNKFTLINFKAPLYAVFWNYYNSKN